MADYRHVHHGPGIILIAHDAHYVMDMAEGRLGLLYSRRRETHPTRSALHGVEERLASVLHCTLVACQQLEAEPALQGRCRFRGDELLLRLNDRLHAPNTGEAYAAMQQHLAPFLALLYPGSLVTVAAGGRTHGPLDRAYQGRGKPGCQHTSGAPCAYWLLLDTTAAPPQRETIAVRTRAQHSQSIGVQ